MFGLEISRTNTNSIAPVRFIQLTPVVLLFLNEKDNSTFYLKFCGYETLIMLVYFHDVIFVIVIFVILLLFEKEDQ